MSLHPFPQIDHSRCTGCGRCIETCPTDALAQVAGKATLVAPDVCTYCTACEDICPEGAIALPFLIVLGDSWSPEQAFSREGTSHVN